VKLESEQQEREEQPGVEPEEQDQQQSAGAAVKQEQKPQAAAGVCIDSDVGFALTEATHTLRSFAAAADWAKRAHFSAQPCNAEFIAMLQPPAGGKHLPATPSSKRHRSDASQQQQQQQKLSHKDSAGAAGAGDDEPLSDTAASDSEDSMPATTAAAAPTRQSSRLQQRNTQQKGPRSKGATPALTGGMEDADDGRPRNSKSATAAIAHAHTSAAAAAASGGVSGGVSGGSLSSQKRCLHAASSTGATVGAANSLGQPQVSIAQIEAEFWRIVERPDSGRIVETMYGQDLDGGRHGSGFPLPAWRGVPSDVRRYWANPWGGRDCNSTACGACLGKWSWLWLMRCDTNLAHTWLGLVWGRVAARTANEMLGWVPGAQCPMWHGAPQQFRMSCHFVSK
jgi:hypothetical protein